MIESPLLAELGGYIAGEWVDADTGDTFDVINPADGDCLARVPGMGEGQVARAVEAAHDAYGRSVSAEERCRWLSEIAAALAAHTTELARIITLEHGKPLREGAAEVEYSAGFFSFFAENLHRLEAEVLAGRPHGLQWKVHHRPAGVAALITPWNFPLAMLAKKLAAALAAGCGIVTKPASQTPLTCIALYGLMHRIGVPAGRVNLVLGKAGPIGKVFCTHPAVRLISFTGSTDVGKVLASQAAPHLKRMALELGGNAPFIVFDDAPIETAVDALIANKFRAGGQTCVCTNRVYVHERIAEPFAAAVVDRTRRLEVGDGMLPGTDIGPLIDRNGFDKVAEHVSDAMRRGAVRLAGDDPPRPACDWGAFYPPTVLVGVTPEMLVCREETFGPVVAIAAFAGEAEAIEQANATPYGLAAYLFTRDPVRAERLVRRLRFGHVGLNTGSGPTPEAPFGGMKASGYGREGGIEGLLEFCETQVVAGS